MDPKQGIDYEMVNGQVVWYLLCPKSSKPETTCTCADCLAWRIIRDYEKGKGVKV